MSVLTDMQEMVRYMQQQLADARTTIEMLQARVDYHMRIATQQELELKDLRLKYKTANDEINVMEQHTQVLQAQVDANRAGSGAP